MNRPYRQGDVPLVPCAMPTGKLTEKPRDGGKVILAYGEVTGHAHAIHGDGACVLTIDNKEFLHVEDSAISTITPEKIEEAHDGVSLRVYDVSGLIYRMEKDMQSRLQLGEPIEIAGETLQHEEHDAIVLPPGWYNLPGQREYTSADMPSIRVQD
jgi:hypothetical protein